MKKNLYLLTFLFFISPMAQANNDLFLKKEFIYKGDTLRYRVLFPDNYDRTKSYPLVLFLHGSGESGSDNEKQLTNGATLFANPQNRADFPAIVLFPQYPTAGDWVRLDEKPNDKFNFVNDKKPTKALGLVKKNSRQLSENGSC